MKTHPFKIYRKEHGLSQERFGEMLSLSAASVNRIEHGKQNITPAVAHRAELATNLAFSRMGLLYPDS